MAIEAITFLLVKHFLLDFVFQTDEHIKYKGVYGHPSGIQHSHIHALGTMFVLAWFITPAMALYAGIIDGIIHYHIDWLKMKYGEKNINHKNFWIHLGLDQLLHQLTYIALCLVFIN